MSHPVVPSGSEALGSMNSDFDWDRFDPRSYHQHIYGRLRNDDRTIIPIVRDFFAEHMSVVATEPLRGVDVGSGANLYPALSILPYCSTIHFWEHSAANVTWLRREVVNYRPSWDQFWDLLRERRAYADIANPRNRLANTAQVTKASIFDLPAGRWDVGTMFFVAESLTADTDEFMGAVRCFIAALRPGSPFAAAFIAGSTSYHVAHVRYPSVAVEANDIATILRPLAVEVSISSINSDAGWHDGYEGVLLAHGITATVETGQ